MDYLKNIVPKNIVPKSIVSKNIVPKSIIPQNRIPKSIIPKSIIPQNIIPEKQTNISNSGGHNIILFLIFFIIPVIIIVLVIINFATKDQKYKSLKFPTYDNTGKQNSSGVKQKGIIPDGQDSNSGCSFPGTTNEKCGCPMLYIGGDAKKYRDSNNRSACPSLFNDEQWAGCSGDASLYQQMLACYSVRNCDLERNAFSHNRCIKSSEVGHKCPDMFPKLSLEEQQKICDVANKSIKTLNPKKGCKFTKSAFGNSCDNY